jgi:hypothetical protein
MYQSVNPVMKTTIDIGIIVVVEYP